MECWSKPPSSVIKIHLATRVWLIVPRSPDYKSGEHSECVVAVDLNLIRWLVDLPTKWLSCARKHTRKTNLNTQACEVHPFYAIEGNSRFVRYHFAREI